MSLPQLSSHSGVGGAGPRGTPAAPSGCWWQSAGNASVGRNWSSLKEWGLSSRVLGGVIFLFGCSVWFWARRVEALGSRIGRRPTAERPEVLDANAARRTLFTAEKAGAVAPGAFGGGGSSACSSVVVLGVDRPGERAVGHLFAARGGMECCDRGYGRTGSIRGGDLATGGGHDQHDPRPTAV